MRAEQGTGSVIETPPIDGGVVEPKLLAAATLSGQLSSIFELTKPRITKLVVVTSGVGFALAAMRRSWTPGDVAIAGLGCIAGTALSSAGASTLNMWWERRRDASMKRTATRPLPENRLSPAAALTSGLLLSVVGVLVLSMLCGPAPALVSLVTIALYVLIYTPLKTVTPLNTIVGAVPGALPPLIGFTTGAAWAPMMLMRADEAAARAELSMASLLDPAGWSLVVLMTVWQIPHFLALAWMYNEDYAQGGYRMLPIEDPDGRRTTAAIVLWGVALLPCVLAPVVLCRDLLGPLYAAVAGVSTALFLFLCVRLLKDRSRASARRVFLGSISHLPLILLVMMADAALHRFVLGLGSPMTVGAVFP